MRKVALASLAVVCTGALALSIHAANAAQSTTAAPATVTAAATSLATGDARAVGEPTLPPVCTTVPAQRSTSNRTFSTADETTPPDTSRIQAALDACAAKNASQAAVELKASGASTAFLSGPLTIGANTVLLIDSGVTLYGSRNPANYQVSGGPTCGTIAASKNTFDFGCQPLIHVTKANAGIMGTVSGSGVQGRIDGRGDLQMIGKSQSWWQLADAANGASGVKQMNPRMIQTDGANNFTVYHVSLTNSPKFHIYLQGGTGITVWGVKISTPSTARNTDGIDPASATNVTIANNWVQAGDDGVAIKGNAGAAKNITIRDNHFYGTHGISIGSETLGVSNVLVSNNTLSKADNGIRIKSNASLGGLVTQITYLNTCMTGTKNLLYFDTHYSSNGSLSGSSIPVYTNIVVNGLKAVSSSSGKSTFDGYDAAHPIGLTLENVNLDATKVSNANYANIGLYNSNLTPTGTGVTTTSIAGSGSVPNCSFPAFPGL